MAQVEKGLLLLLLLLKYHIKEKFNLLNALFFVFHFFQGAICQNYQGYSKLSRKFSAERNFQHGFRPKGLSSICVV